MSKLQLLGIDTWPVADRLELLYALSASLPERGGRADSQPLRRDHRRAEDRDPSQPWRDALTDLGGEG